jgi:hypothetical protein
MEGETASAMGEIATFTRVGTRRLVPAPARVEGIVARYQQADMLAETQGGIPMPVAADMAGKAAPVTGAASGLGRATALASAREGADLFLVDVNAGGLAETAAAAGGVRVETKVVDLSTAEACRSAVATAANAFGRLDAPSATSRGSSTSAMPPTCRRPTGRRPWR